MEIIFLTTKSNTSNVNKDNRWLHIITQSENSYRDLSQQQIRYWSFRFLFSLNDKRILRRYFINLILIIHALIIRFRIFHNIF